MSADAPHGLPGRLPAGERILWQGAPDTAALARAALHTRAVALYFAALTLAALAWGHGALATAGCGAAAFALLRLMAWGMARSTTYTLTDRRLVVRIGIALPRSINLPLDRIAAVNLSSGGDVALALTETPPLGWLAIWPHARPWRLARPEPMLRCLPDARDVAARIAEACRAAPNPARTGRPAAIRHTEAIAA